MIIIKNGLLVDPTQQINEIMDVLIENGIVQKVGTSLEIPTDATVIDATGKVVMPGLVDMHVHLREPGYEYKETILTGLQAAVHGGFTSIACMPNTKPYIDDGTVVDSILYKASKYGLADVYPIACITKSQKGEELTEMGLLQQTGAIAYSDDGKSVSNSAVMRRALEYSTFINGLIISHCEDEQLLCDGVMNEGAISTELGLAGIANEVEDLIIARDIMLAKLTNARVHIAHVSTAGGVELIRRGKADGVKVTAEVAPHHLILTDEMVRGYNTNAKVNPPLRSVDDCQALLQGVLDHTIDCIATDHAPHALEDKDVEFDYAANGISGLETSLPLIWTYFYEKNLISLEDLVRLMSSKPADILGIPAGSLRIGSNADMVIIDPQETRCVDPEYFYSKGKNTPFTGLELRGWPSEVIKKGRLVVKQGILQ